MNGKFFEEDIIQYSEDIKENFVLIKTGIETENIALNKPEHTTIKATTETKSVENLDDDFAWLEDAVLESKEKTEEQKMGETKKQAAKKSITKVSATTEIVNNEQPSSNSQHGI